MNLKDAKENPKEFSRQIKEALEDQKEPLSTWQFSIDFTPFSWTLQTYLNQGEFSVYIGPFSFGIFWPIGG